MRYHGGKPQCPGAQLGQRLQAVADHHKPALSTIFNYKSRLQHGSINDSCQAAKAVRRRLYNAAAEI